jgi:NADH-quinone oxidoreductase subunit E
LSGLTSLKDHDAHKVKYNASAQLATDIGDSIKRIDGTEVPLTAPWQGKGKASKAARRDDKMPPAGPDGAQGGRSKGEKPAARNIGDSSDKRSEAPGAAVGVEAVAKPRSGSVAPKTKARGKASVAASAASNAGAGSGQKPTTLTEPKGGSADDLTMIKGVGPKLEAVLNGMGFHHFDQIAGWTGAEVAWVDQNLEGFKGRASRDNWVDQARMLAQGDNTEVSSRAKKDDT